VAPGRFLHCDQIVYCIVPAVLLARGVRLALRGEPGTDLGAGTHHRARAVRRVSNG